LKRKNNKENQKALREISRPFLVLFAFQVEIHTKTWYNEAGLFIFSLWNENKMSEITETR
jgi:hypothetical protein